MTDEALGVAGRVLAIRCVWQLLWYIVTIYTRLTAECDMESTRPYQLLQVAYEVMAGWERDATRYEGTRRLGRQSSRTQASIRSTFLPGNSRGTLSISSATSGGTVSNMANAEELGTWSNFGPSEPSFSFNDYHYPQHRVAESIN